MESNSRRPNQAELPRLQGRPSPEALRKWVDSRYPRLNSAQHGHRDEHDTSKLGQELRMPLKERLEEWGVLLLILGVLLVWVRLLLAAVGMFPLF